MPLRPLFRQRRQPLINLLRHDLRQMDIVLIRMVPARRFAPFAFHFGLQATTVGLSSLFIFCCSPAAASSRPSPLTLKPHSIHDLTGFQRMKNPWPMPWRRMSLVKDAEIAPVRSPPRDTGQALDRHRLADKVVQTAYYQIWMGMRGGKSGRERHHFQPVQRHYHHLV